MHACRIKSEVCEGGKMGGRGKGGNEHSVYVYVWFTWQAFTSVCANTAEKHRNCTSVAAWERSEAAQNTGVK